MSNADGREEQRRDFFLPARVEKQCLTWDEMCAKGWRPFAVVYGDELTSQLVSAIRQDGVFRRELVREMRRAWWWIRNDRFTQHTVLARSIAFVMECDELLQLADIDNTDRRQLGECLSHGCVCDGCDLWDGQRFG